ncbi:MAG: 2-oxoglutarate dehydrogenase E1 component [Legionellales bacterium]|jgi:2-oxoglutarate dehydrogenase E1 component
MQDLRASSLFDGDNAAYLEPIYEQYLIDPSVIDPSLRAQFDALKPIAGQEVAHLPIQQAFLDYAKHKAQISSCAPVEEKEMQVQLLIDAYRCCGHQKAKLDPLELQKHHKTFPELTLEHHHLSEADLNTVFQSSIIDYPQGSLADIIKQLEKIYCGSIGAEYTHVANEEERDWLMKRIEVDFPQLKFSAEKSKSVLSLLNKAEGLERYLHTRFVGQKRFSLEGGDSLIPAMDEIIQQAGLANVKEVVIGMAHRGRLNVLINLLGKAPSDLFQEFEGKAPIELVAGDVKYHQGFSSDIQTKNGSLHLALAFNPSHLEIVSPVVEGSVKARQERRHDREHQQVLPILLHGDSAFAGQGVVMETFSLSQTRGFNTGGTVHIVINNQVGFTTSNPRDTRSTLYCTDIAKMIDAPIFHVNGDDPQAVVFLAQLALEYRMKFKKDIVIDLICYRRHGHNEADEPSATQPLMYQKIRNHPTTAVLYGQQLIKAGIITQEEINTMEIAYRDHLDSGKHILENLIKIPEQDMLVDWRPYVKQDPVQAVDTRINQTALVELAKQLEVLPEGFVLQKQVAKIIEDRHKMTLGELPVDWGYAENLAYATLLHQGFAVRLSGQDCGRGTFAHRHAVLHDQETGTPFCPLAHLAQNQPHFTIIDSLLSEEAVLAFEYGYSTTTPTTLVEWEAQFGDFANGAQVVIDQFISSGEHKWGRLSSLVMLLPHGYEGMGPEHSSARLERYLQLCAEHNMLVCVPSTPAQVFHMIRRQMLAPFRKPLIVMTPKSLLRHKLAVSTLTELADGEFKRILPEVDELAPQNVQRVILCSGKVYYDLLAKRRADNRSDVAIVRIEQLYPFPEAGLRQLLAHYTQAKNVIWCQEEPQNQGAWYCTQHHLRAALAAHQTLEYAGRAASSSPAAGYHSIHVSEQNSLVEQALG